MVVQLGHLQVGGVFIINCKHRKDRRTQMKKQIRKKGKFPVQWILANLNEKNPERGKFFSHLRVIKEAKKRFMKKIVILEDDAKILTPSLNIPKTPNEWFMLYFGGNVQQIFEDQETNISHSWKRTSCLTTHAYALQNVVFEKDGKNVRFFDVLLQEAYAYANNPDNKRIAIDDFYCNTIHPKYKTYMLTPEYVVQFGGYSDVKKRHTTYNQIITANANDADDIEITSIDPAENEVQTDENGNSLVRLKLPYIDNVDLPHVAIVMPTHNCRDMFYFAIQNFFKFTYPKNKLQWIIADDSDPAQKVRDLIPQDERIKYINCKMTSNNYLTVGKKLNLCLSYVGPEVKYVLHMFDDIYYPPLSIISRVKVLIANKARGKKCCGCAEFGVYDIMQNKSFHSYIPDVEDNKTIVNIGSMGYAKSFWTERHFDENKINMTGYHFTKGRLSQVCTLPYNFVMYALDYHQKIKNVKYTRKDENSQQSKNFIDEWDSKTQQFIRVMKELLEE